MKNIFVAAILLFALGGAFAQTKKSHFEAGFDARKYIEINLSEKDKFVKEFRKTLLTDIMRRKLLTAGKTKLWTEKSQ